MTLSRVPLVVLALVLLSKGHILLGCIIGTFGFLTDLEGFVARATNSVSKLGKIMDPIADAMSFIIIYLYLLMNNEFINLGLLPSLVLVFFMFRIAINTVMVMYFTVKKVPQDQLNVNYTGKVAAALQMIFVGVWFWSYPLIDFGYSVSLDLGNQISFTFYWALFFTLCLAALFALQSLKRYLSTAKRLHQEFLSA